MLTSLSFSIAFILWDQNLPYSKETKMLLKNFELTLTKVKNYKIWQKGLWQSNCNFDFFIFRHRFRITRQKFLKFDGDKNAAEKFWVDINESEKLQICQKCLWLHNCNIDFLSFAIAFVLWDQNFWNLKETKIKILPKNFELTLTKAKSYKIGRKGL